MYSFSVYFITHLCFFSLFECLPSRGHRGCVYICVFLLLPFFFLFALDCAVNLFIYFCFCTKIFLRDWRCQGCLIEIWQWKIFIVIAFTWIYSRIFWEFPMKWAHIRTHILYAPLHSESSFTIVHRPIERREQKEIAWQNQRSLHLMHGFCCCFCIYMFFLLKIIL